MPSDLIEEEEATGPEALQVEQTNIFICYMHASAGRPYLFFGGTGFPSLPDVQFGVELKPETTAAEAQELADLINRRSVGLWARFWDRPLEGRALYDIGENGLAKLGRVRDSDRFG